MNRNFERSLSLVLKHEGGYVDHPSDPGGATNLGVTIGTLSDWFGRPATKADVKALTVKDVSPIYRRRYWDAVRGDDLPAGLDYAAFDFAVNSGPSRAIKMLQAILSVEQDGRIGPLTMSAIKAHNPLNLIDRLCKARMTFLRALPTFKTFGKGWTRRVDGVLQEASMMVASPPASMPPDYAPPEPGTTKPGAKRSPAGAIIIALILAALAGGFFLLTR